MIRKGKENKLDLSVDGVCKILYECEPEDPSRQLFDLIEFQLDLLGTGSTVCSFYCVETYIVVIPHLSKVFIMKRTLNVV